MTCVPAPCCKAALAEATVLWPDRSKVQDGICASPQHHRQNPNSDHERGEAFDLTHDPLHGCDCHVLAEQAIRDPRIKYVIWNRRIWNPSVSESWRAYTGTDPHDKHMHVSILQSARDNTASWWGEEDDVTEAELMRIIDGVADEVMKRLADDEHEVAANRIRKAAHASDRLAVDKFGPGY